MSDIDRSNLQTIAQGFAQLNDVLGILANQPVTLDSLADRSISGDKIYAGKIAKLQSVGIRDDATQLVVVIDDDGITTDSIDVDNIVGETTVTGRLHMRQGAQVHGNMFVDGELTVTKLNVNELISDVRQERNSPLTFTPDDNGSIHGKGLLFVGDAHTRQFVYQGDKFFSTETIDLHTDSSFAIGGTSVLSNDTLGTNVVNSSLRNVGTLRNLQTIGDLVIDQFIFWNTNTMRLGIGTDAGNALVSIVDADAEFIIQPDTNSITIGAYTTTDLNIVTDNTTRISISESGKIVLGSNIESKTVVHGKLGINITPSADVDISTAGPVRLEGKKFEVGNNTPTNGTYRKGDIVWSDNPKPTGYVGWICVREGTPGTWKPFGQIAS